MLSNWFQRVWRRVSAPPGRRRPVSYRPTAEGLEDRAVPAFAAPVVVPLGFAPTTFTVGDFNFDGRDDLAVASLPLQRVSIFLSFSDSRQGPVFVPVQTITTAFPPRGLAAGFFDFDGTLDLAVSDGVTLATQILAGNGNGTFRTDLNFISALPVFPRVTGDFNGDGILDPIFFIPGSGTITITPSVPAFASPDQAFRYVDRVFQDLLGRPPDPAARNFFGTALAQNQLTPAQFVQIVLASPEFLARQVQGVYTTFLGRPADPAGLNAGVAFLQAGGTVQQLQANVAGSDEYFQVRGGGTNAGFLAALFQDALGRPIDAAGQAFYSQALAQGMSRTQVAAQVLNSNEFFQRTAQSFYQNLLRRPASASEQAALAAALAQGVPTNVILTTFLTSQEYLQLV